MCCRERKQDFHGLTANISKILGITKLKYRILGSHGNTEINQMNFSRFNLCHLGLRSIDKFVPLFLWTNINNKMFVSPQFRDHSNIILHATLLALFDCFYSGLNWPACYWYYYTRHVLEMMTRLWNVSCPVHSRVYCILPALPTPSGDAAETEIIFIRERFSQILL